MTRYNSILNKIAVIVLLAAISTTAAAQNIRTAYFMDDATHRHQLNPAFQSKTGFVSIPALGSIQAGFGTNTLSIPNLFYPNPDTPGELVTFLHSSVDASKFLGSLKENNHMNLDFSMPILSTAFYTKIGYFTFDASVKTYMGVSLPKGLFEFTKLGQTATNGQTYNFSNMNIDASSYIDVGLGYSRQINERLTLGGKVKVLFGYADAKIHYSDVEATMTEEEWQMRAHGSLDVSVVGISDKGNVGENLKSLDLSPGFGFNGMGAGIDLGASYKTIDLFDGMAGEVFDNMTFSGAIIDLGFINWNSKNTISAVANGDPFIFDGFDLDFLDESDTPSLEDQLEDLGKDLEEAFNFNKTEPASRTRMLRATLNLGAEYAMLDDKLSFGLLSSTRFGAPATWSELTLSGNYHPISWFGVTLSYSFIHSHFQTFGWALNFSPSWINFFIGSDYMITNVTKQFAPKTNAMNFNFGISVPISGNRAKN